MSEDRRHIAVMFTDIVGYTTLMGSDEDKAFETLKRNHTIHETLIKKHNGTLIKEIGDGTLCSFPLASDAVRCAIEIQKEAKDQDIPLKIGLHEGEMVMAGEDVLGDGVNIASRLQEASKEGCITISGKVYSDIKNKAGIKTKYIGEKKLKNVDDPVKVYEVLCEEDQKPEEDKPLKRKIKTLYFLIAGIIVVLAAVIIWQILPKGEKDEVVEETVSAEIDPSIAVLPFTDMSPNKDQEYFSDGIMDAILMHLCKIGDLEVKSRTSVMQYKGTTKTSPQIAEELGVAHILEGSVSKSGDKIRIIAQLIDATQDKHLWAETYDKEIVDVFAIQSEVAQMIASSLKAELSVDVKERVEAIPTENVEAYELYLKGNETYWASHDSLDIDKIYESINYFEKAIDLDNNFSLAYTGMGRSYWWLAHTSVGIIDKIRPELWEKSLKNLNKAIQLDPNNGWAYAEKIVVYSNYYWDSTATRIALEKATESMPSDRNAYTNYFSHAFSLGNCEKLSWIIEHEKSYQPGLNNPYSEWNILLLTCQKKYADIVSIAEKNWENHLEIELAWNIYNACLATESYELAHHMIDFIKKTVKQDWGKYVDVWLFARKRDKEKTI
ncbi:adenylate/guanylate cyclase domain-containing protein, partial [Bacteroidota bacterium]